MIKKNVVEKFLCNINVIKTFMFYISASIEKCVCVCVYCVRLGNATALNGEKAT